MTNTTNTASNWNLFTRAWDLVAGAYARDCKVAQRAMMRAAKKAKA